MLVLFKDCQKIIKNIVKLILTKNSQKSSSDCPSKKLMNPDFNKNSAKNLTKKNINFVLVKNR